MPGAHFGMDKPKSDRYLLEPEFLQIEGPLIPRFTNCEVVIHGDTNNTDVTHESLA